jgi:hypothetical protein
VEKICAAISDLLGHYDRAINKERPKNPRLVDRRFFQYILKRFTYFCTEKAMLEYSLGKTILDALEKLEEPYSFDPEAGCQIYCESPLRFGIPCKC